MVKKFLSVFAVASAMLATSCSNEDFENGLNGNEADVTFTAQLPEGLQSRAFGDGTTAQTLSYAVYLKKDGNWTLTSAGKKDEEITDLKKTVSLRLVNGNTYQVVFWADAQNSVYNFDNTNRKVTANYTDITSNEEKLDAFFAVEEITVNGTSSKDVELKRPFAQLNIGTADLPAATTAGTKVTKAGIKVRAYQTLNFDGTVSDLSASEVTFGAANLPTNETFPVSGNEYLTMNYLLMSADKQADNTVTIFYDNAQAPERTFSNVPLQRNYRTNIYGNLLTSNEGFNVEIKPGFEGNENISISDGTVSDYLTTDAEGRLHIKSAADFAYLMSTTQNQNSAYAGKTIILDTDIDFAGQTITGVGSEACNFAGNFNGNDHTISNFVIDQSNREFYGGLFNQMSTPNYVKNLKVKGATVTANKMAGIIASSLEEGATVENCHVENCIVVAKIKKAGAIVGYTADGTVKNCTAKNSFVYCADPADAESGEIVGYTNLDSTVDNNTATNVIVVRNTVPALISTAEEFAALNNEIAEIHFVKDINMKNSLETKNFAIKYINVYGHNYTISGLNKPLFNFFGCTVKVADLNVTNSTVAANSGQLGCGAIVERAEFCNLTMANCNVSETKIESNEDTRYGLLVGYLIGGGSITNCSVTNCEVKVSSGAVGGIVGHEARHDDYTNSLSISDCTVSGTKLETSDSGDWRVGEIIGTVAGTETSINNCNTSKNTLAQTNKTAPEGQSSLYGRVSGGNVTIN